MDENEKLQDRIYQMEFRLSAVERAQAVSNAEFIYIKKGIDDIKTDIKSFSQWATRLIIGAIVIALIGFIVSGGIASAAVLVI